MTTSEDFVRAIVRAPTDLTLRLVYADWVEDGNGTDHDRARAEMIRVDAEIDRLRSVYWADAGFASAADYGNRVLTLQRRHAEIAREWAYNWLGNAPETLTLFGKKGVAQFTRPEVWRYGFVYKFPAVFAVWTAPPSWSGSWDGGQHDALIRLVRKFPVCLMPCRVTPYHTGRAEWWWFSTPTPPAFSGPPYAARVHPHVFSKLTPARLESWPSRPTPVPAAAYDSAEAARDDLARAVTRAFREKAGLPDVDLTALDRPHKVQQ